MRSVGRYESFEDVLGGGDLSHLWLYAEPRTYTKDQVLLSASENADDLYLVQRGRFEAWLLHKKTKTTNIPAGSTTRPRPCARIVWFIRAHGRDGQ